MYKFTKVGQIAKAYIYLFLAKLYLDPRTVVRFL